MHRRSISHKDLDKKLDPAADQPERFEAIARKLVNALDATAIDLEVTDPQSWRNPSIESQGGPRTSYMNQFRADVEAIRIMDREEEARLARRIEFARLRLRAALERAGLDESAVVPAAGLGSPALTSATPCEDPEAAKLPCEVVKRSIELHALRTEMVERNLYLVLINVERYTHTGASRVDLVQEGCVSLFRAVDGFDWRRGLLFRTYAVHWLNQAFRNYLYNFNSTVRVPVYLQKAMKHVNEAKARLGDAKASAGAIAAVSKLEENLVSAAMSAARGTYSIDAESSDGGEGSRLRDLLRVESEDGMYSTKLESVTLEGGLARALERLSEREREVIRLRFGVGEERAHTLAEVAEHLHVSVERIRQIQMRAISKLNTPGLRRELEPWLN